MDNFVPTSGSTMYKNILIPILLDHPEKAEEAVAIAKGVLSPDGKLTLLHVVEEIPGYVASQLPNDILQNTLSAAKEEMEKIAGSMKGEVTAKVVVGHSSRTILEFAENSGTIAQTNGVDCLRLPSTPTRGKHVVLPRAVLPQRKTKRC